MNNRKQAIKYIFFDFISAMLAWGLFYRFRKVYLEPSKFGYEVPVDYNENFFYALIIIPTCWILLYASTGFYRNSYRKSRLKEFSQTITASLFGCILLFFMFILDDEIDTYQDYYLSFLYILFFHFVITYFFRFIQLAMLTSLKIEI